MLPVFFGQFADVGIRAPEQNGILRQALVEPRYLRAFTNHTLPAKRILMPRVVNEADKPGTSILELGM